MNSVPQDINMLFWKEDTTIDFAFFFNVMLSTLHDHIYDMLSMAFLHSCEVFYASKTFLLSSPLF